MTEEKIKRVIADINHCLQIDPDEDLVMMSMRTAKDIKESLEELIALRAHEEKTHQFCKNVCEPQYKAEVKRLRQNSTELRPCYVGARKALFHKWEKKQTASPLGGMLEFTVALVEFENGSIETRNPQHIRFADSAGLFKQFAFDEEREAKING